MSNALLLTVIGMAITGIILGMNLALRIIRSIPMFGGGYQTVLPSNPTANRPTKDDSGGVFFTFLMLVFFILAVLWVTTNPKYTTAEEIQSKPPNVEKPQSYEEVSAPNTFHQAVKPVVVHEVEMVRRVNQTPVHDEEEVDEYCSIQMGAFSDYAKAAKLQKQLIEYTPIIIEEADLYKVIIGKFLTAEAAKLHLESYPILTEDGFVRTVTIST